MKVKFEAGRTRATRYFESITWLTSELWSKFRGKCAVILTLMCASLFFRFSAYIILSRYIHFVEKGGTVIVPLLGVEVAASDYSLLVYTSLLCLILFAGSSLSRYFSETKALSIMINYEADCVQRSADGIAKFGGHKRVKKWQPYFIKLINVDPRLCGLTARMSLRLFMPIAITITTITWLFYLDVILTSIVLLIILFSMPVLYKINLKGARYSLALEEKSALASSAKKRAIEETANMHGINLKTDNSDCSDRKVSLEPVIFSALDAYQHRVRATEESTLLTSLLMGCTIAIILMYKGTVILGADEGWAFIAIYFIVLRACMAGVTQGSNILTTINRMYPQITRYRTFIEQIEKIQSTAAVTPPTGKFWVSTNQSGKGITLEDEFE